MLSANEYQTIGGELLDEICYRHYGNETSLETVLVANPGIAAYTYLPAGLTIKLPLLDQAASTAQAVSLWD